MTASWVWMGATAREVAYECRKAFPKLSSSAAEPLAQFSARLHQSSHLLAAVTVVAGWI
jgi:hypothetical protein